MRARLGTLSCVLLLLAAPAARAEEPEGRRHAPTAEDERLGRAVAERLQVELEGVDRVTLHATRGPLPAGTVLTANVEQATLREVTVAAVTLPDGRAAAAYAVAEAQWALLGIEPEVARVRALVERLRSL